MKTPLFNYHSQAAISTFCWGIYIAFNGLSMIIDPNGVLTTLGFEPTREVWIRLTGLLSLVLGFYYVQMSRYNFTPFYFWKITGHMVGIVIMALLYVEGLAPLPILIICLTDALAALWTAWGIYHDGKKASHSMADLVSK